MTLRSRISAFARRAGLRPQPVVEAVPPPDSPDVAAIKSWSARLGPDRVAAMLDLIERRHGHALSVERGVAVDEHDQPLPWYSYPAIRYLESLEFSDKRVFEFGCGHSSLFWAKRARQVVSVDADSAWAQRITAQAPPNLTVSAVDGAAFAASINAFPGDFDVIVIDDRDRTECATHALSRLAPDGLVILDNSDWFPDTARTLREADLVQIDFSGLGPVNYYTWTTSLFLRPAWRPRPRTDRLPPFAVGGIDPAQPERST